MDEKWTTATFSAGSAIMGAIMGVLSMKTKVSQLEQLRKEDKESFDKFRAFVYQAVRNIETAHQDAAKEQARTYVHVDTCAKCEKGTDGAINGLQITVQDMNKRLTQFIDNFSRRRNDVI